MAENIIIRECVCSHDYQDKRYGKGKRVMNPTKNGHRCTVCKREYTSGDKSKK